MFLLGLYFLLTNALAAEPGQNPANPSSGIDPTPEETTKVFPAFEPKQKQTADEKDFSFGAKKKKPKVKKKASNEIQTMPDPVPKSALGGTSNAEAELLWKLARESFQAAKYQESFDQFRRLQARYPSYAFYSLLPFWLGETALRLEDYEFAQKQFRSFVLVEPHSKASLAARFELARVFVAKKKLNDAYLTSIEILNVLDKGKVKLDPLRDAPFESAALMIRAEGLMAVNQWKRAELSVESALKKLPKGAPTAEPSSSQTDASKPDADQAIAALPPIPEIPELKIPSITLRAESLLLRIRIHDCERYPTSKVLAEDQVIDQLDRRGDCLIQALVHLRNAIRNKAAPDPQVLAVLDLYEAAWRKYFSVSDRPPNPPGNRKKQQLEQYLFELSDKLLQRAHLKRLQTMDLIKAVTLPEEGLSETRVKQVRTLIRTLEKMGRT